MQEGSALQKHSLSNIVVFYWDFLGMNLYNKANYCKI